METFLETAWGDQWENISMITVKHAVELIKEMDEEHGAFWVIIDDNVLEAHKDMQLVGIFENEPDKEYKIQETSWNYIELIFEMFLNGRLEEVRNRFLSS